MQPSARRNLPAGTLTALCIFALILLCGCASSTYLPSSKNLVRSPWHSYDEIVAAFEQVQPYHTDIKGLKDLGFSPEATPNVQVLNYLEIIQRFLPNQSLSLKDLDGGMQDCLATREHCRAYQIVVRHTDSERYGNVLADLFNFHRRTSITGWEFDGIIVLKDNLTVYKLYSGRPQINEYQDRKNPLGPFQNSGDILWEVAK